MDSHQHAKIVSFIWNIADDILRATIPLVPTRDDTLHNNHFVLSAATSPTRSGVDVLALDCETDGLLDEILLEVD